MQRENHGSGGRYERQHDDRELAWGVEPQQAVVVRPDLDEPAQHLGRHDLSDTGVSNNDHAPQDHQSPPGGLSNDQQHRADNSAIAAAPDNAASVRSDTTKS
jgi:hypothetical protein